MLQLAAIFVLCLLLHQSSSIVKNCNGSLVLLTYFPCSSGNNCDLLTHGALHYASREITEILPDQSMSCLYVHLQPVAIDEYYNTLNNPFGPYDTPIHGVIGPTDSSLATFTAPIYGHHYNFIQISYGSQDSTLISSDYPYFYSTVASEHFINRVRIKLLQDFQWERVALLTSDESNYVKTAENLLQLADSIINLNITYLSPIHIFRKHIYSTNQLQRLKNERFNIIIALISEEHSSTLLCQAHQFGLTTSDHVWIFPSMYNPHWWQDDINDNCTDSDMLQAINSTIFIGTQNLHQKLYLREAITNETLKLFPNVTREELELYWIHSRAINAIEATSAIYMSWNRAIDSLLKEGYSPENVLSMFNSLPIHDTVPDELKQEVQIQLNRIIEHWRLSTTREYGQATITQVIDGLECVIGVYYNIISSDDNDTKIYLDNITFSSSYELGTIHPCNYTWENMVTPNDGYCHDVESCSCFLIISPIYMIVIGVIAFFLVIVAVLLLISNCVFWKNKYFKASAPRLTIVMTIGCILLYFTGFSHGLALILNNENSLRQTREEFLPILCTIDSWVYKIACTLIISAQLVRNFRLHRIFQNKRLKDIKHMNDWILLCVVGILTIPTLLILIVDTSVNTLMYNETIHINHPFDCPDMDFPVEYRITIECYPKLLTLGQYLFEFIFAGYVLLLILALLFVTCSNVKVIRDFLREREISAFLIPIFIIICYCLLVYYNTNGILVDGLFTLYMFFHCIIIIFSTCLLISIYIPKFVAMKKKSKSLVLSNEKITKLSNISNHLKYRFSVSSNSN